MKSAINTGCSLENSDCDKLTVLLTKSNYDYLNCKFVCVCVRARARARM
jgi:hypothetical protein